MCENRRSAKFWDRIAVRYSKKPVTDEAAYQKKLDVTRSYFRPEMEVLEFGCGTGSTAIAHAPYVKHIHAIDISPKMIQIAQAKARANKVSNITFEVSMIEDLDLPDNSFDVALGLSILHLLEDMDAAIAKVSRILKPGGIFVTSTVCLGDTMKWFKLIGPLGRLLGLMPYVSVFSRSDLEGSLSQGGFDIDYTWQPGDGKAVFIVARKAA